MSEPITGAAAGVAGMKAIGALGGAGIGAGLAAFVVMAMTKPKGQTEWAVALASTLAGSIGGGACLVSWLGIQHWANDVFGLVAMFGLAFACGLPAWALVRALFAYINKRKDADITEIAKDIKELVP